VIPIKQTHLQPDLQTTDMLPSLVWKPSHFSQCRFQLVKKKKSMRVVELV